MMKKYETIVNEWNTLSIVVALIIGFAMLGLVQAVINSSSVGIVLTIAVMIAISVFEYRARETYVESREYLEDEIFKSAHTKAPQVKEIITKGAIKRK